MTEALLGVISTQGLTDGEVDDHSMYMKYPSKHNNVIFSVLDTHTLLVDVYSSSSLYITVSSLTKLQSL